MPDEPDLEHLQQLAAEMILEASNLTDELTDDEARPLIAWALGQAKAAASQVSAPGPGLASGEDAAGPPDRDLRAALADRLTPVRRTAKAINSLAADRSGLPPQLVAEELAYIADLAGGLPEPPDRAAAAGLAGTGDWQVGLDNGRFVQAVLSVLGTRPSEGGEGLERVHDQGVSFGKEGEGHDDQRTGQAEREGGQIDDDPAGFRGSGDLDRLFDPESLPPTGDGDPGSGTV